MQVGETHLKDKKRKKERKKTSTKLNQTPCYEKIIRVSTRHPCKIKLCCSRLFLMIDSLPYNCPARLKLNRVHSHIVKWTIG